MCRKCGKKMEELKKVTMERTNVIEYQCPDCNYKLEKRQETPSHYNLKKDKFKGGD